ncbi:FG-GAP-like repeat-containing protein [Candidatus Auribacterota bacterium]
MSKWKLTSWMRRASEGSRPVIASEAKQSQRSTKCKEIASSLSLLAMTVLLTAIPFPSLSTPTANAGTFEDGYPDIVFSNNHDGPSAITNSYIYWGSETGPDMTKTELPTQGAEGSSVADLNNDGYLDIVFSNVSNGDSVDINSYIYWGAATAPYTTKTEMSTHGAYGNSVADLNDDGYLDIVFSNCYNEGGAYNVNSYIYWGAATAAYTTKTEMSTYGAYGNSVADLNDDGYLDIVFSSFYNGSSYNTNSFIYWGAESGPYTTKTELFTRGAVDSSVADLNNDGHLDVLFSNSRNGASFDINSYIYWGAETAAYTTKTELSTHATMGNSIADLNKDGFLDIVFSNFSYNSSYNTNSYIYWGAETASYTTKTELLTHAARGVSVGDLNSDSYLDIVFSNSYNGSSSNINSYIYWGAETAAYSTKTELSTLGGHGCSIVGSNIWSGNTSLGNVIPLWATQSDYGSEVLNSWEYGFISTQNELLNSGALDFSDEEIAQLSKLYFDQSGSVEIDGITWTYYSDEIGGHGVPEAWYEDGTYYFQMGSGVQGGGGEVPEPSTVVMMVILLGLGVLYIRKR